MDLINQKVMHKIYGTGIVIAQDDRQITVEFASKTGKFMYPDENTFVKFLRLVDVGVQAAVIQEMEDKKAAAARLKSEEERRRAVEATFVAKQAHRKEDGACHKPAKTARISGQPLTFFVFQGATFDIESAGGFIWAPKRSQSGGKVFHWDNMLLVNEGDIILHGCDGYIKAISVAVSNCYDCSRPKEREFENSWNNEGRRVDLDYTILSHPIKTSDFRYDILEYCSVKYSPFDKDGNGNMGYLYELNLELARIFLRAAAQKNPYLTDADYINSLITEQ